jgi:hypothetical protein
MSKDSLTVSAAVLRRAITEVLAPLFEVTKQLLDALRGRESDKDSSRLRTVIDKRVRNTWRSEDRIAWSQSKPLIADFDDNSPLSWVATLT